LLPYYLSFGGGFLSFFPPSPPGYLFWSLSPPSWHWGEWWFAHFEECIVASITTQELEEDLASVSASIGDLVGGSEAEVMAEKTWDFGESLVTEKMIKKMEKEGYLSASRAEPALLGETIRPLI
jgi:hypothetical protein